MSGKWGDVVVASSRLNQAAELTQTYNNVLEVGHPCAVEVVRIVLRRKSRVAHARAAKRGYVFDVLGFEAVDRTARHVEGKKRRAAAARAVAHEREFGRAMGEGGLLHCRKHIVIELFVLVPQACHHIRRRLVVFVRLEKTRWEGGGRGRGPVRRCDSCVGRCLGRACGWWWCGISPL